jgi:predicted porin
MPVGIYVTYASAPADATIANSYNPNTLTKSAFNISGEIGVIPELVTVGAAIRRGHSGVEDGDGANETDNAILLTATYKLSQNMLASVSYTTASGSYWNQVNPDTVVNPNGLDNTHLTGSKTVTLNLFTLF